MNLTEMRRWLGERNIQLTRSLGQNFLHDGNQLRRIVAAAELEPEQPVLEVGPGLGPLTELLLAGGRRVLAIEKDRRLVEVLRERFTGEDQLELIEADALDWLRTADRDWSEWRLVSNLPYSVASPILVDLALSARPPAALVATLQLEVVQRIAARPATPEYGVLTLLLGLRYEVTDWFKVPRDCFFPVPDVDSGCVILTRRAGPVVAPEVGKAFVEAVKRGFGQRRKMLRKLLAEQWGKEAVDRALTSAGVSLTERAERLTREQFLTLAEHLAA
jgi:16S rRNA (adenine1518-N6/adenine1519-N6)-dimethyltransferase